MEELLAQSLVLEVWNEGRSKAKRVQLGCATVPIGLAIDYGKAIELPLLHEGDSTAWYSRRGTL